MLKVAVNPAFAVANLPSPNGLITANPESTEVSFTETINQLLPGIASSSKERNLIRRRTLSEIDSPSGQDAIAPNLITAQLAVSNNNPNAENNNIASVHNWVISHLQNQSPVQNTSTSPVKTILNAQKQRDSLISSESITPTQLPQERQIDSILINPSLQTHQQSINHRLQPELLTKESSQSDNFQLNPKEISGNAQSLLNHEGEINPQGNENGVQEKKPLAEVSKVSQGINPREVFRNAQSLNNLPQGINIEGVSGNVQSSNREENYREEGYGEINQVQLNRAGEINPQGNENGVQERKPLVEVSKVSQEINPEEISGNAQSLNNVPQGINIEVVSGNAQSLNRDGNYGEINQVQLNHEVDIKPQGNENRVQERKPFPEVSKVPQGINIEVVSGNAQPPNREEDYGEINQVQLNHEVDIKPQGNENRVQERKPFPEVSKVPQGINIEGVSGNAQSLNRDGNYGEINQVQLNHEVDIKPQGNENRVQERKPFPEVSKVPQGINIEVVSGNAQPPNREEDYGEINQVQLNRVGEVNPQGNENGVQERKPLAEVSKVSQGINIEEVSGNMQSPNREENYGEINQVQLNRVGEVNPQGNENGVQERKPLAEVSKVSQGINIEEVSGNAQSLNYLQKEINPGGVSGNAQSLNREENYGEENRVKLNRVGEIKPQGNENRVQERKPLAEVSKSNVPQGVNPEVAQSLNNVPQGINIEEVSGNMQSSSREENYGEINQIQLNRVGEIKPQGNENRVQERKPLSEVSKVSQGINIEEVSGNAQYLNNVPQGINIEKVSGNMQSSSREENYGEINQVQLNRAGEIKPQGNENRVQERKPLSEVSKVSQGINIEEVSGNAQYLNNVPQGINIEKVSGNMQSSSREENYGEINQVQLNRAGEIKPQGNENRVQERKPLAEVSKVSQEINPEEVSKNAQYLNNVPQGINIEEVSGNTQPLNREENYGEISQVQLNHVGEINPQENANRVEERKPLAEVSKVSQEINPEVVSGNVQYLNNVPQGINIEVVSGNAQSLNREEDYGEINQVQLNHVGEINPQENANRVQERKPLAEVSKVSQGINIEEVSGNAQSLNREEDYGEINQVQLNHEVDINPQGNENRVQERKPLAEVSKVSQGINIEEVSGNAQPLNREENYGEINQVQLNHVGEIKPQGNANRVQERKPLAEVSKVSQGINIEEVSGNAQYLNNVPQGINIEVVSENAQPLNREENYGEINQVQLNHVGEIKPQGNANRVEERKPLAEVSKVSQEINPEVVSGNAQPLNREEDYGEISQVQLNHVGEIKPQGNANRVQERKPLAEVSKVSQGINIEEVSGNAQYLNNVPQGINIEVVSENAQPLNREENYGEINQVQLNHVGEIKPQGNENRVQERKLLAEVSKSNVPQGVNPEVAQSLNNVPQGINIEEVSGNAQPLNREEDYGEISQVQLNHVGEINPQENANRVQERKPLAEVSKVSQGINIEEVSGNAQSLNREEDYGEINQVQLNREVDINPQGNENRVQERKPLAEVSKVSQEINPEEVSRNAQSLNNVPQGINIEKVSGNAQSLNRDGNYGEINQVQLNSVGEIKPQENENRVQERKPLAEVSKSNVPQEVNPEVAQSLNNVSQGINIEKVSENAQPLNREENYGEINQVQLNHVGEIKPQGNENRVQERKPLPEMSKSNVPQGINIEVVSGNTQPLNREEDYGEISQVQLNHVGEINPQENANRVQERKPLAEVSKVSQGINIEEVSGNAQSLNREEDYGEINQVQLNREVDINPQGNENRVQERKPLVEVSKVSQKINPEEVSRNAQSLNNVPQGINIEVVSGNAQSLNRDGNYGEINQVQLNREVDINPQGNENRVQERKPLVEVSKVSQKINPEEVSRNAQSLNNVPQGINIEEVSGNAQSLNREEDYGEINQVQLNREVDINPQGNENRVQERKPLVEVSKVSQKINPEEVSRNAQSLNNVPQGINIEVVSGNAQSLNRDGNYGEINQVQLNRVGEINPQENENRVQERKPFSHIENSINSQQVISQSNEKFLYQNKNNELVIQNIEITKIHPEITTLNETISMLNENLDQELDTSIKEDPVELSFSDEKSPATEIGNSIEGNIILPNTKIDIPEKQQFSQLQIEQSSDLPLALDNPHWENDLAQRVQWMTHNQIHRAELQVTPNNLGPLNLQVEFSDGKTLVNFITPHTVVRDTLENALPQLREKLEAQGIQLAGAGVYHQGGGNASENWRQQRELELFQANGVRIRRPVTSAPIIHSTHSGDMRGQVDYFA